MQHSVGVLIIGVKGAVATTLISAGLSSLSTNRQSFALPSEQDPVFAELSLTPLSAMHFGGWDVASASLSESIKHHRVIPQHIQMELAEQLEQVFVKPGITLEPAPIHDELDPNLRRAQQVKTREHWLKNYERTSKP